MSAGPLVTGPFAGVLERHRPRFNAAFAGARRSLRGLDPTAFSDHLIHRTAPLVERVAASSENDTSDAVGIALYDLSLELFVKGILGGPDRYPAVTRAWTDLFPTIAGFIATAPRRMPAVIVNALCNLSAEKGADADRWLDVMTALVRLCPDGETFLRAGQVAAWRWGMAHYRESALSLCHDLPAAVVAAILDLPEGSDAAYVETVLSNLSADPWYDPAILPDRQYKTLSRIGGVGGFRGFGGAFLNPPRAATGADGRIYLSDSEATFVLHADRFGATLHRAAAAMAKPEKNGPFSIDAAGKVRRDGASRKFPRLAGAASFAATEHTLAVCLDLSHHVHIVAWRSDSHG